MKNINLKSARTGNHKKGLSRFVIIGLATVVATLCFAFIPMKQDKGDKWDAPAEASKVKNPVASNDASIAEGKKTYLSSCKSCHGLKGKGDGPKAAKLDKECGDFTKDDFAKESDGAIFWKITNGKKTHAFFQGRFI